MGKPLCGSLLGMARSLNGRARILCTMAVMCSLYHWFRLVEIGAMTHEIGAMTQPDSRDELSYMPRRRQVFRWEQS